MNILKRIFIVIILTFIFLNANAQVLISDDTGNQTPDPSAILEIKSTTQGLLIPRMNTAERTLLTVTAAEGLLIYDTDDNAFYIRGNGVWIDLSSSAEIWSKSASNVFLKNSTDNIGVGTSSPGSKFVIQADATDTREDVLFEVIGTDGIPVFEVTTNGVKISVNGDAKAVSRGFTVGQYNSAKATFLDYFTVDNLGNTRVHLNDDGTKVISGGFAVGQYNSAKGTPIEEYLNVASDHTQVNSTIPAGKAISGGFAVGQYNSAKGTSNFMNITPDNYFIGHDAGLATTPGTDPLGRYNLFLGFESGTTNTIGYQNTFLGHNTGHANLEGYKNVFVGTGSGYSNQYGNFNLFAGFESGYSNTGTSGSLTNGNYNVFLGYNCGYSNTTGWNNVYIGSDAGHDNLIGKNNVMVGTLSGEKNSSSENVFLGSEAGRYTTSGDNNIFLGSSAGVGSSSEPNTGNNNIFIGTNSGMSNTTGVKNIYIGFEAGKMSTGNGNVMIGEGVGRSVTTGYANTLYGQLAGANLTTGNQNVLLGVNAGNNITTGNGNVCIGYKAGINETGANKLYISNWGTTTTLIYGEFSPTNDNGYVQINKRLNIAGEYTFPSVDGTTANQVMVTNGSGVLSWTPTLNIDNDWTVSGSDMYSGVSGNVGIGEVLPNTKLHIKQNANNVGIRIEHNTNTNYWETGIGVSSLNYKFLYNGSIVADITNSTGAYNVLSDKRLKTEIQEMNSVISSLMKLKPSYYRYINSPKSQKLSMGFIAQDVEILFPEIVTDFIDDESGVKYKGLAYDNFGVIAIKAIQEQQGQIQKQQTEIDILKQQIQELKDLIQKK